MVKPGKHRVNGKLGLRPAGQAEGGTEPNFDDLLGRLEDLMQGVREFARLVSLFETMSMMGPSTIDEPNAVAARIWEFADGVLERIADWPNLVDRLERVAEALHPQG